MENQEKVNVRVSKTEYELFKLWMKQKEESERKTEKKEKFDKYISALMEYKKVEWNNNEISDLISEIFENIDVFSKKLESRVQRLNKLLNDSNL